MDNKLSYKNGFGINAGDELVTVRGKKYIALGGAWMRITREGKSIPTVNVMDPETGKKRMVRYVDVKKMS
jgi:hypothetical protein